MAFRETPISGVTKFLRLFKKKFPDIIIYPINRKADRIDGVEVCSSLEELPDVPDLVVTVVLPEITLRVVEKAIKLGIKRIWMQPGSESAQAIKRAEEAGITFYHHTCIVESSRAGKIIKIEINVINKTIVKFKCLSTAKT